MLGITYKEKWRYRTRPFAFQEISSQIFNTHSPPNELISSWMPVVLMIMYDLTHSCFVTCIIQHLFNFSIEYKKKICQLLLRDYSYLKKHEWLCNLTQTPAMMEQFYGVQIICKSISYTTFKMGHDKQYKCYLHIYSMWWVTIIFNF
jgi:hypothetical protein